MRTLSRFWMFLFFLALSLQAQPNTPGKYAVIAPKKGDDFLATLDHLSDQGYRLIVGGEYLILRLDATPPDSQLGTQVTTRFSCAFCACLSSALLG
jgi:hypothetical protein